MGKLKCPRCNSEDIKNEGFVTTLVNKVDIVEWNYHCFKCSNDFTITKQVTKNHKFKDITPPPKDKLVPMDILKSMSILVDYTYGDEQTHYQECTRSEKENHIFLHIKKINNYLDKIGVE